MDNLSCPNCSSEMQLISDPDIKFEKCIECNSRFYDKGELNEVLTGLYGNIEMCSTSIDSDFTEKTTRNCPKCKGQKMKKHSMLLSDDIIYDFCPVCEGFFLDDTELEKSNMELAEISEDKKSDEYRVKEGDFLVKGSIEDAFQISTSNIGASYAQEGKVFKISVLFPKPLSDNLRISPEKWTFKLSKLLGINKSQDITVSNDEFNSKFIIQSESEESAIAILSEDVMSKILKFVNSPIELFEKTNSFEVNKNGIHYTEGPFTNVKDFDFYKESSAIHKHLLEIARAIFK